MRRVAKNLGLRVPFCGTLSVHKKQEFGESLHLAGPSSTEMMEVNSTGYVFECTRKAPVVDFERTCLVYHSTECVFD